MKLQLLSLNKSNSIYIFLILVLLSSACSKTPDPIKYIPAEKTSWVISFHLSNISRKAKDWQKIFENPLLQSLSMPNLKNAKKLLKNITKSGANFTQKSYFFGFYSEEEAKENYFAFAFQLNSESEFDKFLRNSEEKYTIKSFSGMRYVLLDDRSIIGWVNNVAILISMEKKTSENDLKDKLQKHRDLPESESLIKNNEQLQDLLKEHYDIATWVNMNHFTPPIKHYLRSFLLPIDLNLDKNYITSITKFEDGEVNIDMNFHNLNSSFKDYKPMLKGEIDKKLIENSPVKSPIAVVGLGLNMQNIQKTINSWNLINIIESLTGINPDDVASVLTGDIIVVLKDIKAIKKSKKYDYEIVFGLRVKSEKELDRMFKKFMKEELLTKEEGFYIAPQTASYLAYKDKILYITTSENIKNNILSGSMEKLGKDYDKISTKGCFSLYSNLTKETRQKLPKDLISDDVIMQTIIRNLELPAKNISIITSPINDKNISNTKIKLDFKDKKKNALQSIIESVEGKENL